MRLLIVQYGGDYRATARLLAQGGSETYYAQKYSIDAVAALVPHVQTVAIVCCTTAEPYNEVLESGVHAIGCGFSHGQISEKALVQLIAAQKPTHLVVQFPNRAVLRWATRHHVKTIVILPESIVTNGLRRQISAYLTARLLNHAGIEWVGSYGIAAALGLRQIGVKTSKIIPWDFLVGTEPSAVPPKSPRNGSTRYDLVYVGSMMVEKGVTDILHAIAILRAQNQLVRLKLVGHDTTGFFAEQAKQLAITDSVEFLGVVSTSSIEPLMREADAVLVASHHDYPEGFPLVIHHALCARTPLIASDHPMFRQHLQHGINAMIFPAQNAEALALCVQQLMSDPELYQRLSQAAHSTWQSLRLPVKWADIINRWLINSSRDRQWLKEHHLSSGLYCSTILE